MDVFLQEHGKTIFIAVCILLLVGVAYVIGPIISNAVKDVVELLIICNIWFSSREDSFGKLKK